MKRIVGYFPDEPTWRAIKENDYRKKFSHDIAIKYLINEIQESITREMDSMPSSSFYSAIRFLFPEVTHLSHLYYGYKGRDWESRESKYVARFMRKFKILHPKCGVYYQVFRHGLMHSHHPKQVRKLSGWYISSDTKLEDVFGIYIPDLKNQLIATVEQMIVELKTERNKKGRYRLNKFLEALVDVGEILTKKKLKGYARYDLNR